MQYLLSKVDFSKLHAGERKIVFGISTVDLGYVQPIFLAEDESLGGYRSIVSQHLNGFAQLPGCQAISESVFMSLHESCEAAGVEWDHGVACSIHIRRLNLWSADLGDLKLKGAHE